MTIDIHNYEAWAMEYLEGTLDGEVAQEFALFLRSHPTIDKQLRELGDALPRITAQPEVISFPHKERLLQGRAIRAARHVERFQQLGAFVSGAAAAAVLFGGLLFFHPHKESGTTRLVAQATESYPEGAEALARTQEEEITENTPSTATPALAVVLPAKKVNALLPTEKIATTPSAALPLANEPLTQSQSAAINTQTIAEKVAPDTKLYVAPQLITDLPIVVSPGKTAQQHPTVTAKTTTQPGKTTNQIKHTTALSSKPRTDVVEEEEGGLLSMLNDLSPISRYRTSEENGISIVSIIHISKKNDKKQQ